MTIWEYRVNPQFRSEFIALYDSEGEWVQWFKKSTDYIETELICSVENPNVFVTIDKWKTKEAYENFYASDQDTYNRLDQTGDGYTDEEKLIGKFSDA